ncbi:MnhB domain-containing protein [Natronoflexus pectinivorans]|uniref:Multicomponent Na+:H+ antiporter subunit B n=1 Tax=Natronoflexus pectinivorans TaxID=682526 RepID=A0A4R2GJ91_9BACT|nr:MnhB domain-containing protein [Natronoflexus pectinivorans]TCO08730.1 multicomponent Na+:H+ antiporter subunit B [Natronoflexus pectinivorans]
MRNLILEKIAIIYLRAILIVSVWLLLRGHNEPGGGFIAGIIASTGFILYAIVYGSTAVEKTLRYNTRNWIGSGLLIILIAVVLPLIWGKPAMTSIWMTLPDSISSYVHIGTPLLFDIGVYVAVIGIILSIIITIMDVLKWNS